MSKSKKFGQMQDDALLDEATDTLNLDDDLEALFNDLATPEKDGPELVSNTLAGVKARKKAEAVIEKAQTKLSQSKNEDEVLQLQANIEKLNQALLQYQTQNRLTLPSGKQVDSEYTMVDPALCIPHSLNTRVLADHNRHTLKQRMASFQRQGQQEPALVTPGENGQYLVVDGAGRLKTWELLREDHPGEYTGDVFFVRIATISNEDVPALSKTRNESEAMSDWNLALVYKSMLDANTYPDLITLCKHEGISYESWKKKMSLVNVPKEYVSLFVKSSHIPSTFASKIVSWDKVIGKNTKAQNGLKSLMNNLAEKTARYLTGAGEAPYPIDKGNANVLIKQIQEFVDQYKPVKAVPKEKPIMISGKNISGTAKKDRNGKFVIKLDKCDDATFQSIMDTIQRLQ